MPVMVRSSPGIRATSLSAQVGGSEQIILEGESICGSIKFQISQLLFARKPRQIGLFQQGVSPK